MKREKRKKKAKQRRREIEEKKTGRSKEKSPKPAWPLFFSPEPVASDRV